MSSITIAETLRRLPGWTIELHLDHLQRSASDAEVVQLCGQNGWALVTIDDMRYTPETKAAIRRSGVAVFRVITGDEIHGIELAALIVNAKEKMLSLLRQNRGAFAAHVRRDGSVEIMTRYEEFEDAPLTPSQRRTMNKYGRR